MPFDFSLVTAPFRMQPDLRRAAPDTVALTACEPGGRHLREKIAVLEAHASQALLAEPQFDAAPALRKLADECAGQVLPPFRFENTLACAAPRLDWSLVDGRPTGCGDAAIGALLRALPAGQRPAALLSLAFEEDFAIVDGASATVPWLAVCLPSRWAPEKKLGRSLAAIHAPVADGELLRAASDGLVRLVTGGGRWERTVWTITAEPRLAQHPGRAGTDWAASSADPQARAGAAFFRSEHQSFLPVAGARQAIFVIHVRSEPLTDAVTDTDAAARLHAALASMSPAVLAYRRLDVARDDLLEWLHRRSLARA